MENIGDPNKLLERFARRVVRKAYEKAGRPRSEFRNAWKHRNDSVFPYDDEDIYQGAGQVNPYITYDYDDYVSRKQAYADSLKNYNAAVEFDRIKRLPADSNEKYEAARRYANKYFDRISYSDVDKYPSDMIRGVFDGAHYIDALGLYIPRKGIKSGDEYMRGYSGWHKTSYELSKAGDKLMKPRQEVIYQEKPKTYHYDISREIQYPNTDDAQIWRILIGRNEYNLNPNAADFERYKEPRYRGINSVVTDADRDAWNKRFSIEPFTREMTDEEAAKLEKQGYTVKKRQQEARQKGGEMDVSDVILGVQGDRPYDYAYYEDNDDYDYEAAERDGEVADEEGHMSDKYKKSNHPSYSTESTEHAGQYLGGRWVYPEDSSWRYDNGSPVFVPSEFNKEVIWDRYHMSPEAFYAMYSDLTKDKVLLPEFQMAGENNVPTYHSPDPAIVTGKPSFLSPGWWSKTADKLDNFALAAGFVPVVGDAASFLADVGANFARYQYDKNDPTLPEWQRKEIAKTNLKSGLGLAGAAALAGLIPGVSMPSWSVRKIEKAFKNNKLNTITDKQWDKAYNHVLKNNDLEEAQRLRDLHFLSKAKENSIIKNDKPVVLYHSKHEDGNKKFTTFKKFNDSDFIYTSDSPIVSKTYIENKSNLNKDTFYDNIKNNEYTYRLYGVKDNHLGDIDAKGNRWYDISFNDKSTTLSEIVDLANSNKNNSFSIFNFIDEGKNSSKERLSFLGLKNLPDVLTSPSKKTIPELKSTTRAFKHPWQLKLSDAITYDNAGNIIPLSKRDNFNVNDIRYGLVPPALLIGTGAAAYNRFNKDNGGSIRLRSLNQ